MLHKQSITYEESNAVEQIWGYYDLNFDSKMGGIRRNNRRIWHID